MKSEIDPDLGWMMDRVSDGDGAPAIQSDGKTCFRFNRAVSCYRYEYLGMLLLSMLAYYSSGH